MLNIDTNGIIGKSTATITGVGDLNANSLNSTLNNVFTGKGNNNLIAGNFPATSITGNDNVCIGQGAGNVFNN